MKNQKTIIILPIVGAMMLMSGAASAELISGEDNTGLQECDDTSPQFLTNLQCENAYCGKLTSLCRVVTGPEYFLQHSGSAPVALPKISDDGLTTATCQDGWAATGFEVSAFNSLNYGDDISLYCQEALTYSGGDAVVSTNCEWSDWISEEYWHPAGDIPENGYSMYDWSGQTTPGHSFYVDQWGNAINVDNKAACAAGKVITGMQCSTLNGWCDNMRIQCCDLEAPVACTPDAKNLGSVDGAPQYFNPSCDGDEVTVNTWNGIWNGGGWNWYPTWVVIQIVDENNISLVGDEIDIIAGATTGIFTLNGKDQNGNVNSGNVQEIKIPWSNWNTIQFNLKVGAGRNIKVDWWATNDSLPNCTTIP